MCPLCVARCMLGSYIGFCKSGNNLIARLATVAMCVHACIHCMPMHNSLAGEVYCIDDFKLN